MTLSKDTLTLIQDTNSDLLWTATGSDLLDLDLSS